MYNQNNGMYSGYEVESSTSSSKETFTENKSVEMSGMPMLGSCCSSMNAGYGYGMGSAMMSTPCSPIYECPQERVIHREFVHEVPHIMPINTRIVNHHIYKHSYSPCYTCCEENCVSNVTDCCCNNF